MQRSYGGTVFEPAQQPPDKELTLGPATLALLGLGLLTLCALCFIFGYAVGHRSSESANAAASAGTDGLGTPQASGSLSKPAAGQSGYQPPPVSAASDQPAAADAETTAAASPASSQTVAGAATGSAPQAVPAAASTSQAAAGPSSPIMVQIASVSRQEDADVLVGALRRHGYAVTARRDPADGMLHVQIGPFASHAEAYTMRQKLLNDGYNAIVQP